MSNATDRHAWTKSEAEKKYNALVARLEEVEAEVADERGLRPSDIYLTDPAVDWENTADSHDWRTGDPLVEGTDAWWEMMYGQAVSAAGGRCEELGIDINSYFPKSIY
jgi:hypothetical protein